ncbi:symmetrical bis(5'-nucleosyl)-tetraphosphatase [Methylolobus aquaticus]|nr:symmetrical bis(5'-nucleosyl)-tetraphosphatase [Methylolobus aquaticus]
MALHAVGDVQGCHAELLSLLDEIRFDPAHDRLLLTGDLVNRGPRSLETLRLVRSLGAAATTVLGNHDLHLLAVAFGISRTKRKDTFHDVLDAPDCNELLNWLRRQPLCHREGRYTLVHAGLSPYWTVDEACARAAEVEAVLRGPDCAAFLRQMYGNEPDRWSEQATGWDRLRYIVNAFTRMRYVAPDWRLDFRDKGLPGTQRDGLLPWFEIPGRRSAGAAIVFGHWSTLGFRVSGGCHALDTGCLWGGELTALRLDGASQRVAVPCLNGPEGYQPKG